MLNLRASAIRRRLPDAKLRRALGRLPVAALLPLVLIITLTVFANVLAPYDPLQTDLPHQFQPPVFAGGTWQHVLGTDDLGRDIWSRILLGARISLGIAGVSLIVGMIIGVTVGVISGYVAGSVDALLMRITDLSLSFPALLLAILLAVTFGPKASNVVLAVVFILWAPFARIVRAEVLVVRGAAYVDLARIAGASPMRIILRHILPNVANSIIVMGSLLLGQVILIEAALGFLGAGVPLPAPEWGAMVASGRDYLIIAWWVATLPAVAIMATVLSVNILGNWTRDHFDPKLRTL